MDSRIGARWFVGVAFLIMVVGLVAADKDKNTIRTRLSGLEETAQTIQTKASGEFTATISEDGRSINYEETWQNLSSTITQSHIHFGRPGLTGGVVLWLCYNPAAGTKAPAAPTPTPQLCPTGGNPASPATITGTLTDADVVASPATAGGPNQGIDVGADGFAEMVKAIRTGSAYVNVHTVDHPSGEIRGRLGGFPRFGPREGDNRHDEGHNH